LAPIQFEYDGREYEALITLLACSTFRKNYLNPKLPGDLAIINRIKEAQDVIYTLLGEFKSK